MCQAGAILKDCLRAAKDSNVLEQGQSMMTIEMMMRKMK